MVSEENLLLLIKLITGFLATLTGLILWSKTREASWLFVVIGIVFLYCSILLQALELLGLSNLFLLNYKGFSVLKIIFSSFPFLSFTLAFILFLNGRKRRF